MPTAPTAEELTQAEAVFDAYNSVDPQVSDDLAEQTWASLSDAAKAAWVRQLRATVQSPRNLHFAAPVLAVAAGTAFVLVAASERAIRPELCFFQAPVVFSSALGTVNIALTDSAGALLSDVVTIDGLNGPLQLTPTGGTTIEDAGYHRLYLRVVSDNADLVTGLGTVAVGVVEV